MVILIHLIVNLYILQVYQGQVSNCKANYNSTTNKINITWNNIQSFNSKLNDTAISYNIWLYSKTNNSNLIKFNSTTNLLQLHLETRL